MNPHYEMTTFDNGLRVATFSMPHTSSAAIAVTIGAGSRHETDAQSGLSHLLEHMAFKGTSRLDAKQIAEAFEDIGGDFNAYTSVENTVYYVRLLAEHLPVATRLLAEILQDSVFDEGEMAREKDVITQEIAAHKDSPEDYIQDLFDAMAYPNQPLGRSVIGSEETVASFARQDVLSYMQTHYHAGNMVISAAGNVDHEAFVELVSKCFAQIKLGGTKTSEQTTHGHGANHYAKTLEQTHIMLGYPAPHMHHTDNYVSRLLANILGGGMSSRLFQEIRENRGLAYHVSAYNVAYSDAGMLTMQAGCAPEHREEVVQVMMDELTKLAQHIDDQELSRAKNQLLTGLAMAMENSGSLAGWMGKHLIAYGEFRDMERIMSHILPVKKEQIMALAADIAGKKYSLVSLGE